MSASIVVAGAARTAVGSFNGAFANTPAHELGAVAIKEALVRAGDDDGSGHDLLQSVRACAPDLRTFFGVSTQRVKPEIRDFAMHERCADLCCAA